ncbi:hypothetical protein O6H91_21G065200 [Diphasiastrum complanatum]|uniref:Uncharacterized protein n=1 Tax=Diphasiastrum complanatum TaxID=34168 RepID=A0ACC2ALA5_DIPCM|nr:hypothetical protein O6H91_21G065200 [Diphasiastrum complanatum]
MAAALPRPPLLPGASDLRATLSHRHRPTDLLLCCLSRSASSDGSSCGTAALSIKQTKLGGFETRSSSSRRRRNGKKCMLVCQSQILELAPAAAAAYGLTLLGGGAFSYLRTGSKGSLFGGVTGGISLVVAYFLMQAPETRNIGSAIGFGAAFLFVAVFAIRLAATRKAMPSGLLMAISIAAAVVFFNAYLEARL